MFYDLKAMTVDELRALAQRVRRRIITVVEKNGGHLASNLGAVELTMAIHRRFDLSRDRLIFDTSHQCYVHKLLTGRDGAGFDRLRQSGGYSGFSSPAEHPSDVFTVGHAGTALSAASGLAIAAERAGHRGEIIVLLGDASLSCGLTLEALNNLGRAGRRLILVLNDNGWSIGPGVGCLQRLLKGAPSMETANFFKTFGLNYFGPVDGHDFMALDAVLQAAQQSSGAAIVHARTIKGQGHETAMRDPERFHGRPAGAAPNPTQSSSARFLGSILPSLMERFPSLVTVTAAMDLGTGLASVRHQYPTRHFDVGIAEGHAVTLAAGLAAGGLRPICAIYSTFIQRAIDSLFHDVCLQNLPVILCLDHAGLSVADGDTHHGLYDIAQLACLPHVTIAQPSSVADLHGLLLTALAGRSPFIIRYSKYLLAAGSEAVSMEVTPGRSRRLQEGSDLSIWALGSRRLEQAKVLAAKFRERNISVEIIDPLFIRPLDLVQLQESASRVRLLVSLEDHVYDGGFGSMMAAALQRLQLPTPLESFAWHAPVGHAENAAILEREQGLDDGTVAARILHRLSILADRSAPSLNHSSGD